MDPDWNRDRKYDLKDDSLFCYMMDNDSDGTSGGIGKGCLNAVLVVIISYMLIKLISEIM